MPQHLVGRQAPRYHMLIRPLRSAQTRNARRHLAGVNERGEFNVRGVSAAALQKIGRLPYPSMARIRRCPGAGTSRARPPGLPRTRGSFHRCSPPRARRPPSPGRSLPSPHDLGSIPPNPCWPGARSSDPAPPPEPVDRASDSSDVPSLQVTRSTTIRRVPPPLGQCDRSPHGDCKGADRCSPSGVARRTPPRVVWLRLRATAVAPYAPLVPSLRTQDSGLRTQDSGLRLGPRN
jgi:hypothetical protein